jgi:hypothetical protein
MFKFVIVGFGYLEVVVWMRLESKRGYGGLCGEVEGLGLMMTS